MFNPWHDVEVEYENGEFNSIIEVPMGSKNKYELDKKTGLIKLDRVLHTSTIYPANYGFIPQTLSDDNDPLDVLVLSQLPFYPRTLLKAKAIGVVIMIDQGELDEKIVAVPSKDPAYAKYNDVTELPEHLFREMEHFFEVYKALEHKETNVEKTKGKDVALEVLAKSIKTYDETFGGMKD